MTPAAVDITRVIRAPRERVFAAWTAPHLLVQWWGPGPVTCPEAHIDLREGGAYRIANLETDGSITWISGTFEKVRPPEQLVYTWEVSILTAPPTLVTLDFQTHPEGTRIVLRHERFTEGAIRDMHGRSWELCFDKLETLLAG